MIGSATGEEERGRDQSLKRVFSGLAVFWAGDMARSYVAVWCRDAFWSCRAVSCTCALPLLIDGSARGASPLPRVDKRGGAQAG